MQLAPILWEEQDLPVAQTNPPAIEKAQWCSAWQLGSLAARSGCGCSNWVRLRQPTTTKLPHPNSPSYPGYPVLTVPRPIVAPVLPWISH
ncbi:predicted protein [Histoplasma capsulatum G186AR]|uniref:Uncharacterized protein n=1 Tax=Ajellomyces capsulatus (strain G186AR / H82 / ATCC MYA-2454 / RMSCC 2432) TaxID=447093 RepID=C0NWF3_AJECG|nr:uncharacterized protein HCBG_07483 [Histoplasma capsulatum G186AR]EEH04258.1 predicted protein [Histoplasma capsulatum G186AR]